MNPKIYSWIWKWHFIGGLLSLPVVLLLSTTGIIYLFKDAYEQGDKEKLTKVVVDDYPLTYEKQLEIATKAWGKPPQAMVLPMSENRATVFNIGRFSRTKSLYVDPYRGTVIGKQEVNKTDMHKVRKLHGELLLGGFGTKIVELVACWMFVLLLTGIYLFVPRDKGWKGLFYINRKGTKREQYRNLHGVLGFWFSIILVLMLAGGLPWTDVFGSGFKQVQKATGTGFPGQWKGRGIVSVPKPKMGNRVSLDEMVKEAKRLDLKGIVTIELPKSERGIYSISNRTSDLGQMRKNHYDQYTGQLIYGGTWGDIGILMRARLWVMAFHQGQFGYWNWLLVLVTTIALLGMSITAILSYLARRKKGTWSIPQVSDKVVLDKVLVFIIIGLGMLLPLFGASVILIWTVEKILSKKEITSNSI